MLYALYVLESCRIALVYLLILLDIEVIQVSEKAQLLLYVKVTMINGIRYTNL